MATADLMSRVVALEAALRRIEALLAKLPLRPEHRGLPFDMRLGVLDGTLNAAGSATVSVWAGEPGNEADTGVNVTAWDWLLGQCGSGYSVLANNRVIVARILGTWYVIAASCCYTELEG